MAFKVSQRARSDFIQTSKFKIRKTSQEKILSNRKESNKRFRKIVKIRQNNVRQRIIWKSNPETKTYLQNSWSGADPCRSTKES